MGSAECQVTSFVKELKTFDTKSCVVTNGTTQSGSMIVAFNLQQLTEVCHRNSTKYNSSLCDFDVIASEIFKEGETWVDRTLVKDVMDRLASLHGWTTKITQAHLQCNRFGTNDTTRQFASGSLKSGCPFRITLTPWNRSKTKKVILTTGKQKWIYTDDWSAPVIIQRANCTHGGTCDPGKQNRIATAQRGGEYVKKMPNNALYTLCNYAEQDGKLSTSTIKKVLGPVWPKGKVITKQNVFHVKVKVMRSLKTFKAMNGDYDEFKKLVNESDFLSGIDSEVSLDDD